MSKIRIIVGVTAALGAALGGCASARLAQAAAADPEAIPRMEQADLVRLWKKYGFKGQAPAGCQARVHADRMLAGREYAARLNKIWVVGTSDKPVRMREGWTVRLHVALSFRDPNDREMVFDPCLAPAGVVTQERWLALFDPNGWPTTKTSGEVYTIDSNGVQIAYSPPLHDRLTIPRALATDYVAIKGYCDEARALADNREALSNFLYGMLGTPAEADHVCAPAAARYRVHMEIWDEKLEPAQLRATWSRKLGDPWPDKP